MSDEPRLLPPGPLPLAGPDVQIVQPVGRIGDGLVYLAREGSKQARLREYAPPGVVRRLRTGAFFPLEPRLASAWQDATERFLEQGHRLASLDHPGIAPIWRAASVQAEGVRQGAYLIGSPVGEPLSAALASGLRLSPAEIVRLAGELSDVLAAVHARGLTHLDISPDTVSLASGWLELTDFAVDNRPFMPLLQTQDGLVRPGYSPIEHHDASMAEPLGPRADVYAACALLYRLITGRDPAAWQERWRDPYVSRLPDTPAFPRDFLEAIRRGMAIEPEERFHDAAEWSAAMALPAMAHLDATRRRARPVDFGTATAPAPEPRVTDAPAPPPPPPPPAPPPPPPVTTPVTGPAAEPPRAAGPIDPIPNPPRVPTTPPIWVEPTSRRRNRLLPLLLVLGLLAAALLAYLAYSQGWLAPPGSGAEQTDGTDEPGDKEAPDSESGAPAIQPGATVSGQLTAGDRRRPGGQYEDRFTLVGDAGDRVELRLGSSQFDPMLTVAGPGFTAANDDDEPRGTRDSRLALTLPRAGRYTVSVTSYRRGGTGDYLLEVATPRPAVSITTPAMLAGRWRQASDPACRSPAVITVEGADLVVLYNGDRSRERILDGVGRTIRTRPAGEGENARTGYQLSEDGDSFELGGDTWVRC